jgi:hypothetical protein
MAKVRKECLISTNHKVKNGVSWDVTPCGSYKNRRFGGTYRSLNQSYKNGWTRNNISRNQQPTHATKTLYFFVLFDHEYGVVTETSSVVRGKWPYISTHHSSLKLPAWAWPILTAHSSAPETTLEIPSPAQSLLSSNTVDTLGQCDRLCGLVVRVPGC